MHPDTLSRRGFLQQSTATLVGAGVPLWFAQEIVAAQDSKREDKKKPSANDQIVMGAIGTGGRGRGIMGHAMNQKGVKMVAVCDADQRRVKQAAEQVNKKNGDKDCKTYEQYRELLDRDDINAVTIGTPDHWHTLVAIDAMRKGKDVYCEKPLTLTIAEGMELVKVARQTGKVLQTGSQQRSEYGGRFRLACELVRNGRIGKLKTIETRIGRNPVGGPFPVAEPPKELNWDLWQGQTPAVPYVAKRCHYEFRWWYEYSGGKMTDWGAHHNDIAQWAQDMDGSGPIMIESEGQKPSGKPNSYNCHPTFKITYTYANGVKLNCASDGENGVKLIGEDGDWIFVSRRKLVASDKKLLEALPKGAERLYPSTNHMGNFIDCVRSRKRPTCDVEIGHRSVTVCHLGVISLRLGGGKLQWDPKKERFVGNEKAQSMVSRKMRKPYTLG